MRILYFLISILALSNLCIAQTSNTTLYKPNAILFMLNKSTNKIEALKKRGLIEYIKEIEEQDEEINRSIMVDFSKNFKYCPVYFFYSDQLELVKKRDWENVIFSDYESLVSNKKIEVHNFGNYYIAEANYPPAPIYESANNGDEPSLTGGEGPENDFANSRDYGIVVYDENFVPLKSKLRFVNISLTKTGNIFKSGSRKYRFIGAAKLTEALIKYIK
jgi:hypothetical protein